MKRSKIYCFLCSLCTCVQALGFTENPRDIQTTRANTLMDDADDIQKQLDNESRGKATYARAQTIWIFHIPAGMGTSPVTAGDQSDIDLMMLHKKHEKVKKSEGSTIDDLIPPDWDYKFQEAWVKKYPDCGGRSQSPVNLPYGTLQHVKGARKMLFVNYFAKPKSMSLVNNGKTLTLVGEWSDNQRPLVYGGAAHSRRYLFHSLVFHWPSEHMIAGIKYPMESHAVHVSIEYPTLDDAIKAAAKDKMAILTVANIYMFADKDQPGLRKLLKTVLSLSYGNQSVSPVPLATYSPPLDEYAAYYGSLTTPPCTEAVLWLIRARSLPITRDFMDLLEGGGAFALEPGQFYVRLPQALNDRTVYFFK